MATGKPFVCIWSRCSFIFLTVIKLRDSYMLDKYLLPRFYSQPIVFPFVWCVYTLTCHDLPVEVRGWLGGVSSPPTLWDLGIDLESQEFCCFADSRLAGHLYHCWFFQGSPVCTFYLAPEMLESTAVSLCIWCPLGSEDSTEVTRPEQ